MYRAAPRKRLALAVPPPQKGHLSHPTYLRVLVIATTPLCAGGLLCGGLRHGGGGVRVFCVSRLTNHDIDSERTDLSQEIVILIPFPRTLKSSQAI